MKLSKDKRTNIEREIDRLINVAEGMNPDTEEYAAVSENIERLYRAKSYESKRAISPDTIVNVAANLIGILLILNYEKSNIVTSKALGFIGKGRV